MIRALLVIIVIAVFLIGGIPLLVYQYILGKTDREKQKLQTQRIMAFVMKAILFVSGTKISVHGLEYLPESSEDTALIVGNHRSMYDILCTYIYMKIPTGFVSKNETKKVPFMPLWMNLMGCIFFDRSDVRQNLKEMTKGMEIVKNGTPLIIYPEGTRIRTPDKDCPAAFKEGSLKIAQKTGCRIIPVAIKNSENIFEMHFPVVKKTKVELWFMEPIYYKDIPRDNTTPGEYIRSLIERRLKGEQNA